ncbi:MAG: OsmC family protein [Desulfobacterales bacterium]|nr:OsmC family protein [Desulfobacterales bacterium]
MSLNHMNLEGVKIFMEEVKEDYSKAKKSKRIECTWNFDEGKHQIESKVQHPRGETILRSDFAPFMGGEGLAPDPIQYCLFGLAACFAGTFMSMATMMGIKIQDIRVSAENFVDLSKTLGLTNNPIVEKVKITTIVKSDAKEEELKELERMAHERCPGVYCLVNPIPLETELVRK